MGNKISVSGYFWHFLDAIFSYSTVCNRGWKIDVIITKLYIFTTDRDVQSYKELSNSMPSALVGIWKKKGENIYKLRTDFKELKVKK